MVGVSQMAKYAIISHMLRFVALMLAFAIVPDLWASNIITNCAQLARHVIGGTGQDGRFHLESVTVISTNDTSLIVLDKDDASPGLYDPHMARWAVRPGDRVRVSGLIVPHSDGECGPHVERLAILERGNPVPPRKLSGKEFLNKSNNFHFVEIHGVVKDVFPDDIDPLFTYLAVLCQGEVICTPIGPHAVIEPSSRIRPNTSPNDHINLVGATIRATGICLPRLFGNRRFLGRTLQTPLCSS